jgi:hypothetical protein
MMAACGRTGQPDQEGRIKRFFIVMAGHSRSKNGVALLAYVPAIHAFRLAAGKDVDARAKRA